MHRKLHDCMTEPARWLLWSDETSHPTRSIHITWMKHNGDCYRRERPAVVRCGWQYVHLLSTCTRWLRRTAEWPARSSRFPAYNRQTPVTAAGNSAHSPSNCFTSHRHSSYHDKPRSYRYVITSTIAKISCNFLGLISFLSTRWPFTYNIVSHQLIWNHTFLLPHINASDNRLDDFLQDIDDSKAPDYTSSSKLLQVTNK